MPRQLLLATIGQRLRAARLARDLSVQDVASAADVSRRYLTEVEAGRANASILKLADLASAVGLPLTDLFERAAGAPVERIALVGLRGAGKSTLGRLLALEREVPFVELDQRVEALAGLKLAEIFDLHGSAGFHRLEAEALEQVLSVEGNLVLAVSGSIVERPATFERLRAACRTIWLRASAEDHVARVLAQGDARPLQDRPRARAELEALLAQREPLYARCDATVDTHGASVEASARALRDAASPLHGTPRRRGSS